MIESKRFQNGSLSLVKTKTTPDTWFVRYYKETGKKRVYYRKRIGTVWEFPHYRDAEKSVLSIRGKVNDEVGSPETVNDLLAQSEVLMTLDQGLATQLTSSTSSSLKW
jgi:hypothetical protein